jgi:hypothetical protein
MKKHFLMLTTAASILACGTAGASAQEDTDNPVMQQLEQAQQDPTDEVNPRYLRPRHDAALHAAMHERGQYDGPAHDEARRYEGRVRHAHYFRVDGSRR